MRPTSVCLLILLHFQPSSNYPWTSWGAVPVSWQWVYLCPFLGILSLRNIWTSGSWNRGSWFSSVQECLTVGASQYCCSKKSEGGRSLVDKKLVYRQTNFCLWESNHNFKAWIFNLFFFWFADKDSYWCVSPSWCSWLDPLQVLDGCSIWSLPSINHK